jgi:hypothetical protein
MNNIMCGISIMVCLKTRVFEACKKRLICPSLEYQWSAWFRISGELTF